MAHFIEAVNAYRPRIEQGDTVQKPELVRALSRATGQGEGSIDHTIRALRDRIIEFTRYGRAVKVEGLGTFSPSIDLDGNLSISFRPNTCFANHLNIPGTFIGTILNYENIGKSRQDLARIWNHNNPGDPIQIQFPEIQVSTSLHEAGNTLQ